MGRSFKLVACLLLVVVILVAMISETKMWDIAEYMVFAILFCLVAFAAIVFSLFSPSPSLSVALPFRSALIGLSFVYALAAVLLTWLGFGRMNTLPMVLWNLTFLALYAVVAAVITTFARREKDDRAANSSGIGLHEQLLTQILNIEMSLTSLDPEYAHLQRDFSRLKDLFLASTPIARAGRVTALDAQIQQQIHRVHEALANSRQEEYPELQGIFLQTTQLMQQREQLLLH